MHVVAFNGSPRKNGNTSLLIDHVCRELETEGISTEVVQLGGTNLHGCRACYRCFETRDCRCAYDPICSMTVWRKCWRQTVLFSVRRLISLA